MDVLDISSDDDVGFNWPATDDCGNDIDWSELYLNLEIHAGINQNQNHDKGYDSDEVVVVKEVLAKPKRAKKSYCVAKLNAQDQEEDEDCVVLEGDPNKSAVKDPESDDGSDDLVIVGEKGQVACRDYPHPRHLCVKLPFDSTPHSDHCNLCHCYVCDSPAPCGNWGNGNLLIDHCHATEKEALWKSERKKAKQGISAPVVSNTDASCQRGLLNRALAPAPAPAPPLAQNSGYHGYIPGQAASYDPPNIIRSQRTVGLSGRNGYRPNLPSRQPIDPYSNDIRRARGRNLNPHSVSCPPIFKSPRPLGRASKAGRAGNDSFNEFRQTYSNHLSGIRLASKQAEMRQLVGYLNESIDYLNESASYLNEAVNLDAHQNPSAVNPSQMYAGPVPIEGQPQQCRQPTCATSSPYVNIDANQTEITYSPMSPYVPTNTSQTSQCFEGFSHPQGGQQLPVTQEQSWNGVNHDFRNLELDTQLLDTLPVPDAPEDGPPGFDIDYLWSFLGRTDSF